jgi:Nucleotide modification associated domain 3
MRLILSRKGFDAAAGGCPSPIFPDGSMISLPIPEESRHRYSDLSWCGRNLGDLVERLTGGDMGRDSGAHLDPDVRRGICPRGADWRPALGQDGPAQGHLRKRRVGAGDLFLFWGLFRRVDQNLHWLGQAEHHIWGWLQVGCLAPVDELVRRGGAEWRWAGEHPHLAYRRDPTNTLYVGAEQLRLPGVAASLPGAGAFERSDSTRRLTCERAGCPSDWCLPSTFLPRERTPLSYNARQDRWSRVHGRAHLRVVGRGQEFVLDLDEYPDVASWVADLFHVN